MSGSTENTAFSASEKPGRREAVLNLATAGRMVSLVRRIVADVLEQETLLAPLRLEQDLLDCQKRTGSAFSAQARWPEGQVLIEGASKSWAHTADSGNRITHHFCAECGSTVHYRIEGKFDGLVAIPLGAFDDPYFLVPNFSVWEGRKHGWVGILGDDIEHMD